MTYSSSSSNQDFQSSIPIINGMLMTSLDAGVVYIDLVKVFYYLKKHFFILINGALYIATTGYVLGLDQPTITFNMQVVLSITMQNSSLEQVYCHPKKCWCKTLYNFSKSSPKSTLFIKIKSSFALKRNLCNLRLTLNLYGFKLKTRRVQMQALYYSQGLSSFILKLDVAGSWFLLALCSFRSKNVTEFLKMYDE